TTSARLTEDSRAEPSASSTAPLPGSLPSRASTADASRTTSFMLGVSPAFLDQFLRQRRAAADVARDQLACLARAGGSGEEDHLVLFQAQQQLVPRPQAQRCDHRIGQP